jgi:hypothetical protein
MMPSRVVTLGNRYAVAGSLSPDGPHDRGVVLVDGNLLGAAQVFNLHILKFDA